MSAQPDDIPLLAYAAMVWNRRFLVLAIILAMVVPAYVYSALQTRQYQATAEILLGSQQIDENFNIDTAALTDTQVGNMVALLTSSVVAQEARAAGAEAEVRAVGSSAANTVTIQAVDNDPQGAVTSIEAYLAAFDDYLTREERRALDGTEAQLEKRVDELNAQAFAAPPARAEALQQQQAELQAQIGRVQAQMELVSSGVTVVQEPTASASPISPTPVRNALLALALGLGLGISVAILLETLRKRSAAAVEPQAPMNGAVAAPTQAMHRLTVEPRQEAPDGGVAATDKLPARPPRAAVPRPEPDLRAARRPSPTTRSSGIW